MQPRQPIGTTDPDDSPMRPVDHGVPRGDDSLLTERVPVVRRDVDVDPATGYCAAILEQLTHHEPMLGVRLSERPHPQSRIHIDPGGGRSTALIAALSGPSEARRSINNVSGTPAAINCIGAVRGRCASIDSLTFNGSVVADMCRTAVRRNGPWRTSGVHPFASPLAPRREN